MTTSVRHRLETLEEASNVHDRPSLRDFIDTAEGRMNCRRRLWWYDLSVFAGEMPSDPDEPNDVRLAKEVLSEDSDEREVADIAEADRVETERVGHTEWRRWSGWREVLLASLLYKIELRCRGDETRWATSPLRGKHWKEFSDSEHWAAFYCKEPGALAFSEYHERRCRAYLEAQAPPS